MSIIKNVALIAGGIWLWNKLKESGPGEYTAPGVDYLPDKYSPNPYIPPDSILNEDQVYHIGLPVQGVPEGVSAVVPIDTYTAVNAMEPVDMQLTIMFFPTAYGTVTSSPMVTLMFSPSVSTLTIAPWALAWPLNVYRVPLVIPRR